MPAPEAADSTALSVTKAWDGTTWQITLSWSGEIGPYTVSYSSDPTFQSGVASLAKNSSAASMTLPADSPNLECYSVTDSSIASPAVQGMGYDPEPAPSVPTASGNGLWWGDSITFVGNYLDPIPTGNTAEMYDQPVRASSVAGGPPYATAATFLIPDDARGFNAFVQAHGRSCTNTGLAFVSLYPRGIGPYTNIQGVAYAPQSGHVWVAADGIAQEIDVFQHDPVLVPGRTWSDLTWPYISRATNTNVILMVDGIYGVTTVYQVDLSSGIRSVFASTHDTSFTRDIWPSGIAVDPDGSACYIADSDQGLVVKIPAGAGSGSTIVDNWGDNVYNFPDPCGIDVNVGHQVVVASADGWTAYIPDQYDTWLYGYTDGVAYSLQVDRDVSTSTGYFVLYTNDNGIAEAFNANAIASSPAAYHAGTIFATPNGYIAVDPAVNYTIYHHWPQRVVINNSGQTAAYPSQYQSQDRVIQMLVEGWRGRKVRLRVIDPPDLSPYAPYGGYPARHDTAVPPYEANDNFGTTDYGVGLLPDGSDAAPSKILTFPQSSTSDVTDIVFYLKVPAQYSGDNFQVEATKCDYDGTVLPQRVMGLSAVYTSWKRAFVERDKMFRRGGLLYQSYGAPGSCGSGTFPPCCTDPDQLPCNQLKVYDWSIIAQGDAIVVFDEVNTVEAGGETRMVDAVVDNGDGTKTITLNLPLTKSYYASERTGLPPMPTFSATDTDTAHSGGIGVIASADLQVYDVDPNQMNGPHAAFYDADMGNAENPYGDANVEFLAPRDGMGVLPFLPEAWFDWASTFDLIASPLCRLSQVWFKNFLAGSGSPPTDLPHNYFHLLGVSFSTQFDGTTLSSGDWSYVARGNMEARGQSPVELLNGSRWVVVHEFGHQFDVNYCSSDDGCHDSRNAWCATVGNCALPSGSPTQICTMNGLYETNSYNTNGVARFCEDDLVSGDPNCGGSINPGAIRTDQDPQ